ncbi:MAG: nucleoside deaminase [Nitrospirota bacterium]|nr:nucleoside deaminase [Nitrospirota bacterium]MDH5575011.1 nucleoside deaminase [Nitrospirota bacterium]MDH5701001.1 nucleoside deaminase [Nitrospirota bacterium]
MSTTPTRFPPFRLELPHWITEYLGQQPETYSTRDARMKLVTMLAQLNIQHGTGGPFGAGVFRLDTNQLVAPGVNLVLSSKSAIAHAEVVAMMMAQQIVGSHDLGATGLPPYELVTSCEPCGMCLGAISWSGVRHLVCGARGSDAEAVGFDEGPKPANWITELEQRGIAVTMDIGRINASSVLQQYVQNGGEVYNGRQG